MLNNLKIMEKNMLNIQEETIETIDSKVSKTEIIC